jgi:YD repeat-containing protein
MKKRIMAAVMLTVLALLAPMVSVNAKEILREGELTVTSALQMDWRTVGSHGLVIGEYSTLYGEFFFENSGTSPRDVRLVLAFYGKESGRLLDMQTQGAEIAANGGEDVLELEYEFGEDVESIYCKIFIWDAFEGVTPLIDYIQFDSEAGEPYPDMYRYNAANQLVRLDKSNGERIFYQYDDNGGLIGRSFEE